MPDAPKVASGPREIKLQLNGGEQRVEVRMTERGGDVHVAVRASDPHLAGLLREDLPDLSARLEQNGFRTGNWHTGGFALADRIGGTDSSATSAQDQEGRSGGERGQQGGREQQSKDPHDPNRKDDRKDFEWLFTSLR
jgi:hypothetical protein